MFITRVCWLHLLVLERNPGLRKLVCQKESKGGAPRTFWPQLLRFTQLAQAHSLTSPRDPLGTRSSVVKFLSFKVAVGSMSNGSLAARMPRYAWGTISPWLEIGFAPSREQIYHRSLDIAQWKGLDQPKLRCKSWASLTSGRWSLTFLAQLSPKFIVQSSFSTQLLEESLALDFLFSLER